MSLFALTKTLSCLKQKWLIMRYLHAQKLYKYIIKDFLFGVPHISKPCDNEIRIFHMNMTMLNYKLDLLLTTYNGIINFFNKYTIETNA